MPSLEGIGLPAGGPTFAQYWSPGSRAQLTAALQEIVGGLRPCELRLDSGIDPSRAAQGQVTMNGQALVHGDDWELAGTSIVVLLGPSCDTFLGDDAATFEASFPCDAVTQ